MIINCTVKELQEMLLLLKAKQEQSKELTGEDMLEGARKAFGYNTPKEAELERLKKPEEN